MSEAVELQSVPETLNPADPKRFSQGTILPIFERMRAEAPVHYCADSPYGPFWSITRYHDIMAVDKNHEVFSSEAKLGGIMIDDFVLSALVPLDLGDEWAIMSATASFDIFFLAAMPGMMVSTNCW